MSKPRTEKQIQIPELLFVKLCQYFLLDQQSAELEKSIIQGLNDKLERHIDHQLYTKYKSAPTDEEKEKARQEYLDRKGISESFRWSEEYEKRRHNGQDN